MMTEFAEPPFNNGLPMCDHLFSGNACCPCGTYKNDMVKSVCVQVSGEQTWPYPFGKRGIGIEDAHVFLKKSHPKASDLEIVVWAWNMQMITGAEYIEELENLGASDLVQAEKML